ncbi:hypothetical protein [Crocosphaera subtropica]|nr:hypothetical protein [Crocosphaera subtropica]
MSQTQVADAIGKRSGSVHEFVNGKSSEASSLQGLPFPKPVLPPDHNIPVKPIPIKAVVPYWVYWSRL